MELRENDEENIEKLDKLFRLGVIDEKLKFNQKWYELIFEVKKITPISLPPLKNLNAFDF